MVVQCLTGMGGCLDKSALTAPTTNQQHKHMANIGVTFSFMLCRPMFKSCTLVLSVSLGDERRRSLKRLSHGGRRILLLSFPVISGDARQEGGLVDGGLLEGQTLRDFRLCLFVQQQW